MNQVKRLIIYFFYDSEGIIDSYVEYMISKLKPFAQDILFVSNGDLLEESREKIKPYCSDIICRENKGFDVWAYKAGIEYYGWEKLAQFDEIIFMNFTIMGPIDSFEHMFKTMEQKDVDFWGITIFHEVPFDPFGVVEYGYLPTHIQSHFIACRKKFFTDKRFQDYWDSKPMIKDYNEAVGLHEAIFTKKFEDMGFKWDVYVDTRDMMDYIHYPLMFAPKKLIIEKKCPIFKRKNFIIDYETVLDSTSGEATLELMEYLEKETNYNVDYIWENIIRTGNQDDIKNNLQLNYIIPNDYEYSKPNERLKTALMLHIYFEDMVDYCYKYAKNMPEDADIYVTTDTEEKGNKIREKFSCLPNNIHVIIIENRGRDVSALLVGLREYVENYDVICFAHDKKVSQLYYKLKGEEFANQCFENILYSKEFVENIITTFAHNKRLGLLTPPPPQFAEYYPTISGYGWGINYEGCVEFAKKYGIKQKIDKNKAPIAPFGTIFWFRTKSLKKLFEINLQYEDFLQEPAGTDGTLMHVIERMYAYVVQHHGYYPAWIFTEKFAKLQITNLQYMLTQLNIEIFKHTGPNMFSVVRKKVWSFGNEVVNRNSIISIKYYNYKIRLKRFIRERFPKVFKLLKRIVKGKDERV